MLEFARVSAESELDVLVAGVLVVDPALGVIKANIGIKDGRIVGIGRAGNPDITAGIDMTIGPGTRQPWIPRLIGLLREERVGAVGAGRFLGKGLVQRSPGRARPTNPSGANHDGIMRLRVGTPPYSHSRGDLFV